MKKCFFIIFLSYFVLGNTYSFTLKTERWQTSNGVSVVFHQAEEVPMVITKIAFKAGSAYDGPYFGLSALTTELLNQGSANLSAAEVGEKLANIGAQYESATDRDKIVFSLKTLSKEPALSEAVSLFSLILSKPVFSQQAFNQEKNRQLLAIKQMQESPSDVANHLFFAKLYQDHPYAHPVYGTAEKVKNIYRSQVLNYYKQYFVSDNAVLIIVGAIDSQQAHQLAETITKNLNRGKAAENITPATGLVNANRADLPFPSSQTMLRIGQLGIDYHNPDYFPLLVGNYILGGGTLVSELAFEVREKRGLSYGVYSQFLPLSGIGPFVISLSTRNEQADKALQVSLDVLKNFIDKGPSEKELTAAKQYLIGNYPLSFASNQNIAEILLRILFYRLPEDYLETYTAHVDIVKSTDIQKAFKDVIKPERMLIVSVGKQ